jgi:putative oxidoreductase
MKIVVLVARLLLGLMFFVFGLNGLLHFMPMPPVPGDAGIWAGIMMQHHWMTFVSVIQVIAGLLLLVNRFVPLALTLLAPELVNILLFHLLLTGGAGIAGGVVCTVLELFLLFVYRRNFFPLLAMNPEADTSKL